MLKKIWDFTVPFIPLLLIVIISITYSSILIPFIISIIAAYLINPIMVFMEKKVKRIVALFIIFVFFSALILGFAFMLLPFIVGDMIQLFKNLPIHIEKIKSYLQLDFPYREQLIQKINANAVSIGNMILNKGYGLLSGSLAFFGTLIAVPIFTFYFLKDKESIVSFFWKFIPKKHERISREFLKTIDTRMKGFFRGQFLDFSVLATILTLGFYVIGLKYAILIAILCAIFNLIPYLGMVLSIAIVGLVAWLQGGTILFIGIILGFFLIVQLVESLVLSPYLIGSSAAVHPLAIVLAIMLGGAAFGLFGILFAIPGLIIIDVLLPHFTSLIDSQKESKRGKRTVE